MKRFFLKALYLGVVLGIVGLAGCQNPFDPIWKPAPQGKGRVMVTVGDAATARTIAPVETIFTKYTLTFTGPAQADPVEVTGGSAQVELVVGNWTITATGYTGTEDSYVAVAEGSVETTVSDGENSPVNILLGPKAGAGSGTFSYSLKIPDGLSNPQLIITNPDGTPVTAIPLTYNPSGISGNQPLASGQYLARIRLQKGSLYAGLTEVLHIYSGLTSTLPLKEYTDADFQAAVGAGFDLSSLVTKPVSWVKPVTAFTDQTQYTGTVAWQTNTGAAFAGATFAENTVYKAVVTLTAKTGYTFTGIATDSFTYTGATTVTNVADSGIVTITFPATAAAPSAPTTNAQHLTMLKSLGVNVDTPDLPVAPNGAPYNPQTSNARAATGAQMSRGPLGKIYSQPLREIFVAGYLTTNDNRNHALYQDFKNSTMTVIGKADGDDTGWAGGQENTRNLRKTVAADLDGDGIDEVVIVVIKDNKILVYKGVYNVGKFTITALPEFSSLPETAGQMLPTDEWNLPHIGWTLITADLNGDGRQECVLTLPGTNAAYMYVLDNDLKPTAISLTPYYTGLPAGHRWFPMVTAADYDQDGKDELCLTIGANGDNFNARYYILDDKDAGYKQLSGNTITSGSFGLRTARVMAGDFTGDGLPDTVFYGTRNSDNTQKVVMLLQTGLNSAFQPVFTWVDSASGTLGDSQLIPQSAVGDVNGDRKADFIANNRLYTLNSENKFEQMAGTDYAFTLNYNGGMYQVAMGDVTGDQKDDVVFFGGGGYIEIYYYANGGYVRSGQKSIAATSFWEIGCLPNVDKDSFILRDTGNRELLFSDPHVIAVLASAPYYAGVNEDGNGGTYFGYTKGSSSGSSNSFGFSVGSSIGFDLEDPFGISGVEVEASMKNSFSWAQSESRDIQESWGWNNVLAQDLVIFTAIPFDVYYYEVLIPPDGAKEKKGDTVTVSVPRKPHHYHMDLPDYNALVPVEHRITLNHTLGEPFSYYRLSDQTTLKSQAGNRGLFSANRDVTAGRGNQSTTVSIDESTTKEDSFSYDLEVEVGAKVKIGSATAGRSVGFSYGYETTSAVSNGTSISGEVPAIPGDYYTADKDFDWGLMAYPKTDPKQSYIFVTYWTEHH